MTDNLDEFIEERKAKLARDKTELESDRSLRAEHYYSTWYKANVSQIKCLVINDFFSQKSKNNLILPNLHSNYILKYAKIPSN